MFFWGIGIASYDILFEFVKLKSSLETFEDTIKVYSTISGRKAQSKWPCVLKAGSFEILRKCLVMYSLTIA